jgi:pimeloyl-ACP methyl ester carboxylesterase
MLEKTLTAGGVDLAYRMAGEGPAVICIQGVGVIGHGWSPQAEALAGRHQVITFDNRGIGRSGAGAPPLTIEAMASDVLAIMDAERIERAHVIGHSLGGLVAQQVALAARQRVRSLALLCTFADGAAPGKLSLRMAVLGLRARVGSRAMRRNGMIRMIMPPEYLRHVDRTALAERLQTLFGRDLADNPPIVSTQLRAMAKYSALARLGELRGIPTLVMTGAHDSIAPPRLGRAIAAAIPDARLVEFPDASHALPIQLVDDVNALLLEHLERCERGGQ